MRVYQRDGWLHSVRQLQQRIKYATFSYKPSEDDCIKLKIVEQIFYFIKSYWQKSKKKYLQYHKNEEEKFEDKYVSKFSAFFRYFASIKYKTFLSIFYHFLLIIIFENKSI